MVDIRRPRRGSLAVRPRKRADKLLHRFNYWKGDAPLLGLIGYKAGMVSVAYRIKRDRITSDEVTAGTVIEVPPLTVYGLRYYFPGGQVRDILTEDKEILKVLGVKKERKNPEINAEEAKEVRALVFSDPKEAGGVDIRHILRAEIGLGGSTVEEQIKNGEELLGKRVKASDLVKPGDMLDVAGVTKGKGWQGPIKRFGVAKQRRKATGKVRHVGTLGPWHPHYIMYYVPQAGQMGYHNRVDLNKQVLYVGSEPLPFFDHYGVVKSEYIIVKGSVPGTPKRPISLRFSVRPGVPQPYEQIRVVK
ncbi:MAG: 50S ribosomal protein L3 [Candidatus Micrarchaeota archaeon]|nr:50S ribosomal protein L3 [Candidatus Micrarchaeota archaeon]